jgi:DNA helicase-2/ATP-dependent DNA helicase PcrA
MVFETLYSKLNPAQKQAVDTIEGPVMVIAGPGTGKTTLLTLRIANILKKTDTPPSGILAITFTDAGVKAMKSKLRDIIGSQADEVRIHTFHGFASSVMSEFPDHFTAIDGFKQMTDIEAVELVRSILEAKEFSSLRPLGKPDLYIHPIISAITEAKREALSVLSIKEYVEKEIDTIKNDEASISTRGASKGELKADAKKKIERLEKTALFADVYAEYEERKKKEKLMDYDDLILKVLVAFGSDELLLRLVQEKYLYLLVDEHQDTNDSQNLMIRLIADFFESPNLFVVGDEKQAIYRFQGASVENFLRFEKAWPNMQVISLEENYRSHQQILDASFAMIETNYAEGEHEKLRVKLRSGLKKDTKPIDLVELDNRQNAEVYLVNEIKRISKEEPEKTVAIISRTNKDVDRVVRLAEEYGLHISAERSIDIFSHPVGNIFFSLIDFVKNPLDVEAFAKTIVVGLWDLDFSDGVALIQKLKKGHIEDVTRNIPSLNQLRALLLEDSPIYFLMKLAELSGFSRLIAADPSYVEVWRGIVNLAEMIVKQYHIRDPLLLIEKLVSYKSVSEGRRIKVSVGVSDAKISVMTAHGSKGLEFDYVFVPYATEESWLPRKRVSHFILPSKKLEKDGDDVRDARRLFYVALTRAREHVTVIWPIEDVSGDLNTPLRFISELDPQSVRLDGHLSRVEALSESQVGGSDSFFDTASSAKSAKMPIKSEKIIEYTKNILLERGLSVTALNHFIQCPATFLFKSILRLPEAPAVTAEKGIAMHSAITSVWKMSEEDRTKEAIENAIKTVSAESVGASFLRAFEKDLILNELAKHTPTVAEYLYPHFHISGESSTESWSERTLDVLHNGKTLPIRLHGKLDTVISTPDEILVFDYKTKKKMSVNEIKGETANSDGGYFRQLVFYRMLLQEQAKKEGKKIIPSLVFLTPDDKGRCDTQTLEIEESDIRDVEAHIKNLVEKVWSGDFLNNRCEEEKCDWCDLVYLFNTSIRSVKKS